MKLILLLALFLIACTAEEDLDQIKGMKMDCESFHGFYKEVSPKKNTSAIDDKIKHCREIGAWNE